MYMFYPENPAWSLQILRMISESLYGGSEFNECYRAIVRITSGNLDHWFSSWNLAATEAEEAAGEAKRLDHVATARKAYLRAANYHRLSGFFLRASDSRAFQAYTDFVRGFQEAASFFDPPIERVEVPFEGGTLSGYFYAVPDEKPRPTLVYVGGADSTSEELYFLGVQEALERGLNCITVDCPGQGSTIWLKKLPIRPDYEKPVASIIDYLTRRREVDPERIAILGRSLGGYHVLRAAAYDRRIKRCAVWGAVYDIPSDISNHNPKGRLRYVWLTGSKTWEEAREKLRAFTLEGAIPKIRCPLLIVHGESDFLVSANAAKRVVEHATCEKTLRLFPSGEAGEHHCQHDNPTATFPLIFDWIADGLGAQT